MGKYMWSFIATIFRNWKIIQGYGPPNASHIHRKCGIIKNGAGWTLIESIIILSIRAIFGDLGWPWRSFACCGTYQMQFNVARFQLTRRVARSLGDSWAFCTFWFFFFWLMSACEHVKIAARIVRYWYSVPASCDGITASEHVKLRRRQRRDGQA